MDKNIQSFFNKLKRRVLKNRRKLNLKTVVQDTAGGLFRTLSSARLPLIIFTFIASVLLLLVFVKYLSISPVSLQFDTGVNEEVLKTYDSNLNILFIVMDDREEGYKFINKMDVVLVDNNAKRVSNLSINEDLIVNLNKEKVPIRNLYNFLDGSSVQRLDNLMLNISNYTGLRLDRYFIVNLSDLETMETLAGFSGSNNLDYINYYKNPLNFLSYILNFEGYREAFRTNLNRVEFTGLMNSFGNFSVTSSSIGIAQGIAEGENISGDQGKIDTAITQFLRDIDILKEQIRVEIYNATSIQGAATKVSRRLKIYGIDVVKTGNYPETVEKSGMFLAGNKAQMISNFNEIKRAFRGDIQELKEYKYNYSGDIILIIGDDYQYLR